MQGSRETGTPARPPSALYQHVWVLGHRLLATHVVGLGRLDPEGLAVASPSLEIVGVVPSGAALPSAPGRWLRWDEVAGLPALPAPPARPLLLCSGLSWLDDPRALLRRLREWSKHAAGLIVMGEPGHRPASPEALGSALEEAGLDPGFLGWTGDGAGRIPVGVVAPEVIPRLPLDRAPERFRVTAVMTAYNEEDIIEASLDRLIEQGIDVHVTDNWSTDSTFDRAASRLGRGVSGVERYPPDGPSPTYRWEALIRRVEEVAATVDADWIVHHDVDEVRMPPWPGASLRDGIYAVDRMGFTAIDHTVLQFPPTDDGFPPGTDFGSYFRHFDFAPARDLLQVKAWKGGEAGAVLMHGGHDVRFPGRRVYPFKFLLRHYPIRSQAHGERKIFAERMLRFKPRERSRGWHRQYEDIPPGASFLRSPSTLRAWDDATFMGDHVLEALCGAASDGGMVRSVGSLPSLLPGGYDVRWARKRGSDGVEYDSVEYDRGDVVYRQGTGDLAAREASILSGLDGDAFPRVLAVRGTDRYSVAILERLEAPTVRTQAAKIVADPASFHRFACGCLAVLADLRRASVEHRDITESTVLLRESGPVLHAFTWARSSSARELGFEPLTGVPPDGVPSDGYAMGRLLARMNAGSFPAFDSVIALMTEPDPTLRVTDVDVLRGLFDAALEQSLGAG
jgi:hypothetical protein